MTKSIPVFKFAFAAYAAAVRKDRDLGKSEGARRQPFEAIFHSTAGGDGVLRVRIDARDDGRAVAGALAAQEVWLGQIEATEAGYSGVICRAQPSLRDAGQDERIEFGLAHIRDWTVSHDALPDGARALK